MCIVRRTNRPGGFTLLEITIAVAILAMMSVAIFRFVATNLTAVRISSEENAADARYSGFINLLSAQMQELSTEAGILGNPYKFSDQSQDEISWICGPGAGLLTRYAAGEYIVSLRLKRAERGDKMELGFMRKPREGPEGSVDGQSWVPLIEGVRSLEIRYFDVRLNTWVEKWTDTRVMPRLVKLIIGRPDRTQPVETVIALGRTHLVMAPPAQPTPVPQQPGGQPGPQPGAQPGPVAGDTGPGKGGGGPGKEPPKK